MSRDAGTPRGRERRGADRRIPPGRLAVVLAGLVAFLAGDMLAAGRAQAAAPQIRLQPVASGLEQPTFVTSARDGTHRLFITEQAGLIKVLRPGAATPTVFLDLRHKVLTGAQQGLTGLAFHPRFADNRRFFVDYTRRPDGATVIAEYRASSGDGDVAEAAESVLLMIAAPLPNLATGMLAFGPDGFLYIGAGNAGVDDDPTNTAQTLGVLLGKILRIDVDHPYNGLPYSSPADNPFIGALPGRDEIFAYGLRNPWRFSFDRLTGDLFAGDVGNRAREEINLITPGGNYGWRVREGTVCHAADPDVCEAPGPIGPLVDYAHSAERCAVMGGYVYRGTQGSLPAGTYVFGDFCSGEIFRLEGHAMRVLLDTSLVITSFGEDEAGELYVVDWRGAVFRIAADTGGGPGLVAAVLPNSRSVPVGGVATAFATMIWTGSGTAKDCGISPLTALPGNFTYQTTAPDTNQPMGRPNTAVPIASGASQTFLIAFTPTASFDARDLLFGFSCADEPPAPVNPALHALLVSAATEPVADIVALVATASQDGIVTIPEGGGVAAFAGATAKFGAAASITASADTGAATLPVGLTLCPTDPARGGCTEAPAPSVTVAVPAGATPTFAIFVATTGAIAFDPAHHRVHVRFRDAAGVTRGLTSVAVRTPP